MTRNTAIVAPYSAITAMYGLPSRTDIDPNPFVAFFYFLFFGIMFGDIGYGVLLFVITAAILLFKRPKNGTKNMMALFLMGGISAALWGIVFGSFFGTTLFESITPAIIDPMEDAVWFLAMSLYLGVFQILVGTLLNFYNRLRLGRIGDAFMGALPRFVLFCGLAMVFPTIIGGLLGLTATAKHAVVDWFAPLAFPGTITTLVGVAGIAIFNGHAKKSIGGKIMGSMAGLYGLVNYFGDILSYARLFGVGLAGSVIGFVANHLAGMFINMGIIGIPFGLIIAVFFHAINIGLGLLSAYVHDARLQFIEFFGKFYSGEGKPFAPLTGKLRYIRIK
jgi:V/A-type H+-transporting ATPase subunit I